MFTGLSVFMGLSVYLRDRVYIYGVGFLFMGWGISSKLFTG